MCRTLPDVFKNIFFCTVSKENDATISEAEYNNLSKLMNKITGIVRHDYMPVDHMRTILSLCNVFGKDYNNKFVATKVLQIVKAWQP